MKPHEEEVPSKSLVDLTVSDGVASIVLRRPEKHNALTVAMVDDLARIFQDLAEDPSARAVVISGEGPSFCAGQDLKEERPVISSPRAAAYDSLRRNIGAIVGNCPLPTIAALHGNVLGRGADIAVATDFKIATPNTRFAYPEVSHGRVLGGGGIERLVRCVGESRAMLTLSFGHFVDVETALEWGLVTSVVDEGHLEKRCMEMAAELTQHSELVLLGIKSAVRRASEALSSAGARTDAITNALRKR